MSQREHLFRLNVGFIAHQSVGYSRDFLFELDRSHLPPDLELYNLVGQARVSRTTQGLLVQVKLSASSSDQCVRCLKQFEQELSPNFTELYAFQSHADEDTELILPENGVIDLEPLVREYMLLEIPIKPVCQPDCLGLCPVCGENRNSTDCDHELESIDPRLAALKSLLD
ncbi:MAG: DUF177 domain-containing protein [Anaerolineales bacterium]